MQFSIDFASNKLAYKFKINDAIELLANLLLKQYNRVRLIKQENIEAIITFASAINKTCYDQSYCFIKINLEFIIYLRFYQDYIIFDLSNKKFLN